MHHQHAANDWRVAGLSRAALPLNCRCLIAIAFCPSARERRQRLTDLHACIHERLPIVEPRFSPMLAWVATKARAKFAASIPPLSLDTQMRYLRQPNKQTNKPLHRPRRVVSICDCARVVHLVTPVDLPGFFSQHVRLASQPVRVAEVSAESGRTESPLRTVRSTHGTFGRTTCMSVLGIRPCVPGPTCQRSRKRLLQYSEAPNPGAAAARALLQ